MKTARFYAPAILAVLTCLPVRGSAYLAAGQEFTGASPEASAEGAALGTSSAESSLYASGTRAINESRWQDAEAIFAKVAAENGEHGDGALYWQAYAENKLGQANKALNTCANLGHEFPSSSWIHECGALEIEIHARSGKPVGPKPGDDDDLKLLALNSLMQKDETRALAQIQEILNSSDSSEKLRNEASFILGHHYSDATYAQVVRISYVEGDVRIARGQQDEKPAAPVWEKAIADLPIETGFNLVTGAGRAEIEFEDASTIYLGENSVLSFNDLHTTSGIPHSELALLSGTATLNIRPSVAGESYTLRTPTDELTTNFPNKSYIRVSSYSDAVAIAAHDGAVLHLQALGDEKIISGQTQFYRGGLRVNATAEESESSFADWDKWVDARVTERKELMAEMMKASGLNSPIPGLAELMGQGTFFECAPYGTCWEPMARGTETASGQRAGTVENAQAGPRPTFGTVSVQQLKTEKGRGMSPAPAQTPTSTYEEWFPCVPNTIRYGLLDPASARWRLLNSPIDLDPNPYNWAVCHAGNWIQRRHRYVWVVDRKIHHLEPVRWVKSGHTVAFVPIHPYDVKGKPPINRKEEVFAVNDKNGLSIAKAKFDPERTVEYLKEPPREYRTAYLHPLTRADVPHMETHSYRDTAIAGKGVLGKPAGTPLTFDPKLQSFMVAHQVLKGEKTVTVVAPVTNRGGNLQAHGGSFAGAHGSSASVGASRGGGGAASSGGSGSRGTASSGGGASRGAASSGTVRSSGTGSSAARSSSVSSSAGAASTAHH